MRSTQHSSSCICCSYCTTTNFEPWLKRVPLVTDRNRWSGKRVAAHSFCAFKKASLPSYPCSRTVGGVCKDCSGFSDLAGRPLAFGRAGAAFGLGSTSGTALAFPCLAPPRIRGKSPSSVGLGRRMASGTPKCWRLNDTGRIRLIDCRLGGWEAGVLPAPRPSRAGLTHARDQCGLDCEQDLSRQRYA